jgi:hypothetical protein
VASAVPVSAAAAPAVLPPSTRVRPSLGAAGLDAAPPVTAGHTPRILVVGDSEASTIGLGLQRVGASTGAAKVWVSGWVGCPMTLGGSFRWNADVVSRIGPECEWSKQRASDLSAIEPDIVVMSTGLWEVADRLFDGSADWVHIGEPSMDDRIEAALAAVTDIERSGGARVVWLLQPPVKNSIYAQLTGPLPEEDPARMARLNQLIRAVAASRSGVWTLDVPAVLRDRYGDPYGLANRPDGIHWSNAGADLDASWMLPLLLDVQHAPMAEPRPVPSPSGAA